MKSKYLIVFPLFLLFLLPYSVSGESQEKALSLKHQAWLELVEYIITSVEKDIFLKLTSDIDRDFFIEAFWKQRDPTAGTPQNEYKEEHIRRVQYANEYYGRGTSRMGSKTDMGRMYIILGPPNSLERFESTKFIVPTQVWYYFGDKDLGLPTYFALVFFKRGGYGDYKLYNPSSDGPMALIENPEGIDYTDYRVQYEKLRELAPTLARVSLTNVPGEMPFNYAPSLRSNIIFARIEEAPKKEIRTTYATHFLDYKGYVSTDYLTNFVEADTQIGISRDQGRGMNFIHFSVVPEKISIDYYEPNDQYYCNYSLNVSLRKGEMVVYQYSKDFPFYFTEDRIPNVQASGISIQDSFPFVEGKYNLIILIQNSVAKEFSVIEREIEIPENDRIQILDSFVGYKVEENPAFSHFAYKIGDKKILVDPKYTFSKNDSPALYFNIIHVKNSFWQTGRADVTITGTRKTDPVEKKLSVELQTLPYAETLDVFQPLPIEELEPDYYEISIALKDNESGQLDLKKIHFVLSTQPQVAHPISLYKIFPLTNSFLYSYALAYQYNKLDEYEKAEAAFEKAYTSMPDYTEGLVEYARFLIRAKKYQRSMELIEKLKDDENLRFDYYLIRGQAYMGMENYSEAADNLIKGNMLYDSDIRLLNSLGFCHYKMGEKTRALEVLKSSLRLNPEQPEIQKLIQEIEKSDK